MPKLNPYLNFDGQAEAAFLFYQSIFGGDFAGGIHRMGDAPGTEALSESSKKRVMHIALPIGKHSLLMANDVPEFLGRTNENENRSKIVISAETKEEADKLFNGLSSGGTVEMPIADSPWGSYFGMFRDKYGIEWMVDFDQRYNGQVR